MALSDAQPWSKASAPVWALVCHFPGEKRRKRQLLVMKAYIDDSGNSGPIAFVLAGYIAPAEAWARFSDAWQAVLDIHPAIPRFKMSEAHGSWSQAEWITRLPLLYRVIEDHVSASVSFALPYDIYREVFAGKDVVDNPYHLAFADIIGLVILNQERLGITEPIDFIFDRGNSQLVMNGWERFIQPLPEAIKKKLGKYPIAGDDEDMLPLQAADLIAWWKRRRIHSIVDKSLQTRPAPWKKTRDIMHLEIAWTPERVLEAYNKMFPT